MSMSESMVLEQPEFGSMSVSFVAIRVCVFSGVMSHLFPYRPKWNILLSAAMVMSDPRASTGSHV